ncbi:MAG: DNA recombination/repair protein RecA, partial [Holosporaceae bacterium]|nr:DNA recombination/repair protein RecA [Holosporaceae bacterium]
KFYASVRLDIRRTGTLKEKEQIVGNQVRVKVVKNKVAPPFKVVDFDIIYGEGISKSGELLDIGAKIGAIEKSGAWYAFEGQKIGQGREAARQFLKDNSSIAEKIEQLIRNKGGAVTLEIADTVLE